MSISLGSRYFILDLYRIVSKPLSEHQPLVSLVVFVMNKTKSSCSYYFGLKIMVCGSKATSVYLV